MPFENKLKKILADGRIAIGSTCQLPSVPIVEIMGMAGYDFVMVDTEHGLYTTDMAGELIRAAQGSGMSAVVRVTKNDPGLILKALDMGANGVVVPHVSNKADAERAVEAAKYGPHGRGACPLVRANGYGLWDWPEFEEYANKNTMVIPIIEDIAGVENIEEIVNVEGIDIIYVGPFDMSVSCGYKGNAQHPEIAKHLDTIFAACKKKGLPAMHSLLNGRDIEAWAAKGVRLFVQSADSVIFARACRDFLASIEGLRTRKWD